MWEDHSLVTVTVEVEVEVVVVVACDVILIVSVSHMISEGDQQHTWQGRFGSIELKSLRNLANAEGTTRFQVRSG